VYQWFITDVRSKSSSTLVEPTCFLSVTVYLSIGLLRACMSLHDTDSALSAPRPIRPHADALNAPSLFPTHDHGPTNSPTTPDAFPVSMKTWISFFSFTGSNPDPTIPNHMVHINRRDQELETSTNTYPTTVIRPMSTDVSYFPAVVAPKNLITTAVSATLQNTIQLQPVCIGHGLDASVDGTIATVILPSALGFVLWVCFHHCACCSLDIYTSSSYCSLSFAHGIANYTPRESGFLNKSELRSTTRGLY
jgi:hypothetical protein